MFRLNIFYFICMKRDAQDMPKRKNPAPIHEGVPSLCQLDDLYV